MDQFIDKRRSGFVTLSQVKRRIVWIAWKTDGHLTLNSGTKIYMDKIRRPKAGEKAIRKVKKWPVDFIIIPAISPAENSARLFM